MVRKDDEVETSDPYMICNELIKNSGDVFSVAYGLYVDDVFYGATAEGQALSMALESILNSYLKGAENETVRFHNDVRLREGFYLDSSLVELSELEELINSKVDYAATYTVVKNDAGLRPVQERYFPNVEVIRRRGYCVLKSVKDSAGNA